MAKKFAVDLFFDIFSPYSFIMFESLLSYRTKWPMSVTLKPFDLTKIFEMSGNRTNPAKLPYIGKDATRLARYHGIPLRFRKDFLTIVAAKSSADAHRLICSVQLADPEKGEAVTRALYRRLWVKQADIFEKKDFLQVLSACGVNNADDIVTAISSDSVNEKMDQNAKEALKTGCFGAPWTVVALDDGKKEAFFGSDRIDVIAHMMGQSYEGPLTSAL